MRSFQNKKAFSKIFLLLWLAIFSCSLFAGEMARPRTVNVISTEYFDILFPAESSATATLLAQNADQIYLNAKQTFNCRYDFRTIVVISPDSETLSVKYTASPYNRIVIFDAVGSIETSSYSNGLLDLFNHEIGRAVSQSVRSETLDFVAKNFLGDAFQPAALFNVPYSFLEGAVYAEDEQFMSGLLYDNWNLQLLMQAKLEGKFPSLIQASGAYDIYPGTSLSIFAAAAFYAYIQQRWGIEKFGEYWQECGKINFFKLEKKIFLAVYGEEIQTVWKDFIDAIPLPPKFETLANEEATPASDEKSELFLKKDYDSNYKFVVSTNYGLVWYDDFKEEVDISGLYDLESPRQLLFLANGVTNLTVSPCGRFLLVSHSQGGIREQFKHDLIRIYDLKNRRFLKEKFEMRDGAVVQFKDGRYGVMGNSTENGHSCLKVYESEQMNLLLGYSDASLSLVYSREFEDGTTPYTPVALGNNHFACLVCRSNEWVVMVSDIVPAPGYPNDEDMYSISNGRNLTDSFSETYKIRNLRYADYVEVTGNKSDRGKGYCLLYDFVLQSTSSFVRTGWLFFDQDSIPVRSIVVTDDYYGGMGSGVMFNCNMYYVSQRLGYSELRRIHLNDIDFEEALISYRTEIQTATEKEPLPEFQSAKYSPWKYMRKGSWKLFMPVRNITLDEGIEKAPGLGGTFETQSDPFTNNKLMISAAKGFVPLEFSQLFNASKRSKDELKAEQIELSKDAAFAVYFQNTSTPADITLASTFKFNENGEYTFNAFSDVLFSLPLSMTFRRMTFDFSAMFNSSTAYWDSTQTDLFPNLYNWPSLSKSYIMLQTTGALKYSNIHQYGVSPLKKLGVSAGTKITFSWEWGRFSPYQIYMGFYGTGEIPYLMPAQNIGSIIVCLPTSVHAELFYTNGKAVDAYAQTMLFGMEVQNGFWRLYFPRVALYAGYDIALEYDTSTVKLPDFRRLEKAYDVFYECYLNDSFYLTLDFGLTPVLGQFSTYQLNSSLRFEKYLRTKEYKLKFDIQIKY